MHTVRRNAGGGWSVGCWRPDGDWFELVLVEGDWHEAMQLANYMNGGSGIARDVADQLNRMAPALMAKLDNL